MVLEKKSVIILGDANICAIKWEDPNANLTETAEELKSSLAQCGLTNIELGYTYLADRLDSQGNIIYQGAKYSNKQSFASSIVSAFSFGNQA